MRSKPFINSRPFFKFFISLMLLASAVSASAQETAATIPASFNGTYELSYGDFSNGSANSFYSDGEAVTMVIKSGGLLCINGEDLSNPVFKNGNMAEAFWSDSDGLEYGVSNIGTEVFNEVNLSLNGSFAGQFSGSKTSDSTTCSSGSGGSSPSLTSSEQSMLDLAETLFAAYFTNGSALKEAQGYVYKIYSSGAAVGFRNGQVFTIGGPFGNKLKTFGAVAQVTASLESYQAKIELNAGDIDTGDTDVDITGDFDLTIDGTIATVVAGITTPPVDFTVTINDIVAPDPGDTDEVSEILVETLEGVEGISDLEVVITNNTSSRVTFSVSFTATQNGVTVNMELEYDYVK